MWRFYIETYICNECILSLEGFRLAKMCALLTQISGLNANESQCKMHSVSLDGRLGATQLCTEIGMENYLPAYVISLLSGQVCWHFATDCNDAL